MHLIYTSLGNFPSYYAYASRANQLPSRQTKRNIIEICESL